MKIIILYIIICSFGYFWKHKYGYCPAEYGSCPNPPDYPSGLPGVWNQLFQSGEVEQRSHLKGCIYKNYFYVFGGNGCPDTYCWSTFNDLWRFDFTKSQWFWVGGWNKGDCYGSWGSKKVKSPQNMISARYGYSMSVDSTGNIWIYGGERNNGTIRYAFNDIWRWDGSVWTWMEGSDKEDQYADYSNTSAMIGSKTYAEMVISDKDVLYIFGGCFIKKGLTYNDMWKYNITAEKLDYVWGPPSHISATPIGQYSNYYIANDGKTYYNNSPAARLKFGFAFDASKKNIFMFGGGFGSRTFNNDIWRYNIESNMWAYYGEGPIYGNYSYSKGITGFGWPAGRDSHSIVIDSFNTIFLFGGEGYDFQGTAPDSLNEFWKYDISSRLWTWINGSTSEITGDCLNYPRGRHSFAMDIDEYNNIIIFGGYKNDGTTTGRIFNNMFIFNLSCSDCDLTYKNCRFDYWNNGSLCVPYQCVPNNCSYPNGTCIGENKCLCKSLFTGDYCQIPICSNACSYPNGTCISPNTCLCKSGYKGSTCEYPICSNDCSTPNGTCVSPNTCLCKNEFSGFDCKQPICFNEVGINACSYPNGTCMGPGYCLCVLSLFGGNKCQYAKCFDKIFPYACSYPNGTCHFNNTCLCNTGYGGSECFPTCFSSIGKKGCSYNGDCVNPDVCVCQKGYYGKQCETMSNDALYILFLLLLFIPIIMCLIIVIIMIIIIVQRFIKREKKLKKTNIELIQKLSNVKDNKETFQAYKNVKILRELGKGSYGSVDEVEVTLKDDSKDTLARKKTSTSMVSQVEIDIMKKCSGNENIIQIKSVDVIGDKIHIFMEKMDISLTSWMYNTKISKEVRFDNMKKIFLSIGKGLRYLHSINVIHRDIKPDNILLKMKELDDITAVKITDFGISKQLDSTFHGNTFVGTIGYIAKEILDGGQKYDNKIDSYSYGIMMCEYVLLKKPQINGYDDIMMKNIYNEISGNIKERDANVICDIIKHCISVETTERYSFIEIVDFISGNK